ncbi:MAG: glycoside hydrolase family 32 protein [Verrucomicrobiota bacterium]
MKTNSQTRLFYFTFTFLIMVGASIDAMAQKVKVKLPDADYIISEAEAAANQHYNQPNRPQFHYTPIQGFVGDATGMVSYEGEHHLFYMSDKWERRKNKSKRWGHAITKDFLHWEEMPSVLDKVQDNGPGSGSGIVDFNNTLGFATGTEKTLVIFYSDYGKGRGTCIAYSTDRGRTWTRHPRNPVLPTLALSDGSRDPLVFWHAPVNEWRMVRFDEKLGFSIFGSKNLLDWTLLSSMDEKFKFNECPDFMELPVEGGAPGEKKWVIFDAGMNYVIGAFDGQKFIPETDKLRGEMGFTKNIYAAQAWKNTIEGNLTQKTVPVQMAFMPYTMEQRFTWHNLMTFPCELRLKKVAEGIRLCRLPVSEISQLYGDEKSWKETPLKAGENLFSDLHGDTYDIDAEFELAEASAVNLGIRGQTVRCGLQKLEVGDRNSSIKLSGNRLHLRLLVDRSSIEAFVDEGQISITKVAFFDPANMNYTLSSEGGEVRVISMVVHRVKSIWGENGLPSKPVVTDPSPHHTP